MKKILVGILLGSTVMLSCSKSNDLVTPTSTSESEKTAIPNVTPNAKLSLPIVGGIVNIKDASTLNLAAGDTLWVPQTVSRVMIYNLKGAPGKPIVVSAPSNVVIGGNDNMSMDIQGSYFKVVNLNIKGKPTAVGIRAYYSSDMTFENITIDGTSIGMMLKNDATPEKSYSYYPNAVIKNVSLKNISVKNASNEGYYIGNTADTQNGYKNSPIVGLTVENCSAENTGWDGFQITSAQNCKVNGVTVINAGTANKTSQTSGITLQDATTGTFENLSVNKSNGAGLTIFGCGNFVVNNVTLKDVALTSKTYGIFVDNRSDRGFNLGAKKLTMSNVSVKQTSVKGKMAMYVVNGTVDGALAAVPGTVTNLTYDVASWEKRTVDFAKNVYVGGTDGK